MFSCSTYSGVPRAVWDINKLRNLGAKPLDAILRRRNVGGSQNINIQYFHALFWHLQNIYNLIREFENNFGFDLRL